MAQQYPVDPEIASISDFNVWATESLAFAVSDVYPGKSDAFN